MKRFITLMSAVVISSQLCALTSYPSTNLIVSIKTGDLTKLNDCITNEANLNVRIGSYNLTPAMLAVDCFVENYLSMKKAVTYSLLLTGLAIGAEVINETMYEHNPVRLALIPAVIGSFYSTYRGINYLIFGSDRFEIIKVLLEQKSVDVTLTNDRQPKQTLLSLVQDHIKEHASSSYLVSRLKEIEELILAKQPKSLVEEDGQVAH